MTQPPYPQGPGFPQSGRPPHGPPPGGMPPGLGGVPGGGRPGYGGQPGYGGPAGYGGPQGPRPPYRAPLPPTGYRVGAQQLPPLPPAGYYGRPPSGGGGGGAGVVVAALGVLVVLSMVGTLVFFAAVTHGDDTSSTAEKTTPSFTYPSTPSSAPMPSTESAAATATSEGTSAEPTTTMVTTPAGPKPVRKLTDNPLFADHNEGLPNAKCSLPRWAATETAATAFFEAAKSCLDKEWQPVLAAHNLPFFSPTVKAPQQAAELTSPCSGDSNYAAVYCPANHTIYMPLDHVQTDVFGDRWYVYLQVFAHEYGHHVQALSGIGDQEASERDDAGFDANTGLELSRRLELEAQCFSGMYIGAAGYVGMFSADQINYMKKDQYGRGDDSQAVDIHDHGTSQHYGDWFGNVGVPNDRVWKCNTWAAPSGDVS
ncbi:neutral zinc metallopeptidase [Nocardia sp. NEAU-G5]|uniref:Neutral zinc metallopeptidase n=1 Tax=Nocardia albiluteola TaxID=2842303 RepID=A0ABS6ASZ3_9NOCA|nr:neutral zinc metallopeptidase [Nocardia albiluteola]MBU3060371.1 neutral zinc metallopeptidase [Nocardia albiluteola]